MESWVVLAAFALGGILSILASFVTGYLVFRSKRDRYDTLIPSFEKITHKPIVTDKDWMEQEDDGIPDIIKNMNEKINSELSREELKRA